MLHRIILSLSCIVYSASILAQNETLLDTTQTHLETNKLTTWDLVKNDASLAWGGFKHVYSRPFHWQKDDIAIASGVILGVAGLNLIDEDANTYFNKQGEKIPDVIHDIGFYFGSPQNNYGLTGGLYLVGLFTKSEKLRRTGILMITAASAAGLVQTVSKTAFGRARPKAGGRFTFKPFSSEGAYHSFPSGHTILAFTTLYSLSKQFDNIWVKAGLITVGMVSPVSRLWAGAHWLTDVALSTALTVVVVDAVDKYLDKNMKPNAALLSEKKARNKISWRFQLGAGTIGLKGTF